MSDFSSFFILKAKAKFLLYLFVFLLHFMEIAGCIHYVMMAHWRLPLEKGFTGPYQVLGDRTFCCMD